MFYLEASDWIGYLGYLSWTVIVTLFTIELFSPHE